MPKLKPKKKKEEEVEEAVETKLPAGSAGYDPDLPLGKQREFIGLVD